MQNNPGIPDPVILAIETSTSVSSAGMFRGGKLLATREYKEGNVHSKLITVMILEAVGEAGLKMKDIQAVAVSRGPGSYTGLRVGVSAAKGIAMGLRVPLISFGSLECIAREVKFEAIEKNALIIPMIDARRMEIYTQVFDKSLNEVEPVSARIVDENTFSGNLKTSKVIFAGDGVSKCSIILEKDPNSILRNEVFSSVRLMGESLNEKYIRKEFEDLLTFEPFYLKDFVVTKQKKGTFG